jgi:hypothetical protein
MHFAGDKHTGQRSEHEVLIEVVKTHAAGDADCFGDGAGCAHGDRQCFDRCRQRGRIGKLFGFVNGWISTVSQGQTGLLLVCRDRLHL